MTRALFRLELAMLLRARFTWIIGALLFAALAWGAINGQANADGQQATVERVKMHAAAKVLKQQADVARYSRPADTVLPYWQDPSDAAGYMRYGLSAYAVKPPSPLAGIAIGQSRLLPFYIKTDLDYVAPPAAAFDFINPRILSLGDFDLSFVLVYVLPLALIAIGASLLAAERDSGALRLMAAQLPSFRQLVMLKFGVAAIVCVPFTLVATVLALLVAGTPCWSMQTAGTVLLLGAALAGLTLFWVALTALLASRIGVVGSYLRLVSVWIGFTFFVPAAGALIIDTAYPAPSPLLYLDDLRRANDFTPANRDALFAAFARAEPAYAAAAERVDKVSYATKQIAVQQAVERQIEERASAAAHQNEAAAGRAAALRWLSPAMVFDTLLQQAAGSGVERHKRFLKRTGEYTDELRAFFWPRALAEAANPANACQGCAARLNFTDHDKIPRFQADRPLDGVAASIGGAVGYLWVLACAVMLMLWSGRRFRL
ncbi:ABC transporter permease subunit [Massilia violaceinigra]|nr:ABC transporter permease subunit [Massilia violaceinigra]